MDRLTPLEQTVLDKARQYYNHRTVENLKYLSTAIKNWIRGEQEKEAAVVVDAARRVM